MALVYFLALGLIPQVVGVAHLLASHYNGNLYSLTLTDNGTLSISSSTPSGATMPSWLTFDADSRTAYVTDESWFGSGTLVSLTVSDAGTLTPSGSTPTKGGDVHSCLYGGDDGKGFIVAAYYDGSSISTYQLPLTSATKPVQTLTFTMDAVGPIPDRQDKPHPHSALLDPTGANLLVPDLGADLIRVFSIDAASGMLSECPNAATAAGDGPRHGEFLAGDDGSLFVYTVNELGNSVSAWNVTYGQDGCLALAHLQTLPTYPASTAAPAGSKSAEVHIRNGTVYASNRNDQSFGARSDSLATFSAAGDGALAFGALADAHAFYPRTFAVSAGGEFVAAGGQTSANVAVLERDVTTGAIGALVASVDVGSQGTDGGEDGLSAVIWV